MPKRPDNLETLRLSLELLRRIPRKHKVTAQELQQQLKDAGIDRDLRSIQRQLDMLRKHFGVECDDSSKPYGYRWLEQARVLAIPTLTPQESLLLGLAEEQLKHLLPPRLSTAMAAFFGQARRNLRHDGNAKLEREWPAKVRVVATSQPLLPAPVKPAVFEAVSEALFSNRWLSVDYQNSAGTRRTAQVMPLGLAQQGPRLFLVCRYQGHDDARSLALHRFHSATVLTSSFERPKDFDLKRYEDDGRFGFGDGERVRLSFRIDRDRGAFLQETPLSADQKVVEHADSTLSISATVVDSAMLEWWLLGFGDALTQVRKRRVAAPKPHTP